MIGARSARLTAGMAIIALLATGCGVSWPPDDPPRHTAAGGARTVVPDLRVATTLTVAQQAALAEGRTMTLDAEQSTALDAALRSLDDRTIDQIATLTATDTTAFADAIQLAGNPRVESFDGADIPLPAAVDTLLTAPPTLPLGAGLHQQVRYSWQQVRHASGPVAVPRLGELGTLADLLAEGTTDLQVGTEVDEDLIAVAGQLAAATADHRLHLVADVGAPPIDSRAVHSVLVDLLDVASRDADAARDAITGTDMPDGYRSDPVLVALLAHPWGADQQPLVDLLAAATAPPAEPSATRPDTNRRADAAAGAIAHTLAAHRAVLTDVPSAGNRSVGALNPDVIRTVTDAISGRLAGLAGTPRLPIDGVEPLADTDSLSETFRVLLTDGPSGLRLADAVDTATRDLAVDFGAHPESPANGAVIGRLTAGLRLAIDRQFADDGRDAADAVYRADAPASADWIDRAESGTPPLLRAEVARSSTTDRYAAVLQGLLSSRPDVAADPAIAPFIADGVVRPIDDVDSAIFEAEMRAWFARANLPLDVFQHDLYAEIGDRGWHI